jgi:hypothetical protein
VTPFYGDDDAVKNNLVFDVLSFHIPNEELFVLSGLRKVKLLLGLPLDTANIRVSGVYNLLKLIVLSVIYVNSECGSKSKAVSRCGKDLRSPNLTSRGSYFLQPG